MANKSFFKIIFTCVVAGVLFSGYMSAVKLFTDTCAFSEPCPYFLGYPACWYGFGMYMLMFLISVFALANKFDIRKAVMVDLIVSYLGILFAGSFVVKEIMRSQITGVLGLSTCTYGLIFYILIFTLSGFYLKRKSLQ